MDQGNISSFMKIHTSNEKEYLQSLNDQQKKAVLECTDPLLVLAGAGSGKTRVITTKIAYLIKDLNCNPRSILAVTFTNKAAAEMKDRVLSIAEGSDDVMVKTFHSFGAWLLRRNAAQLALSDSFTIYDDEDSLTLLHSIFTKYKRVELKPYVRSISKAKDYCLRPDDDLSVISRDPKFPEMYEAYDKKLRGIGNADFGDLISRSVELLKKNPSVRQRIQNRFRAILVDEYQDSNVAQFQLLQQLYGEGSFLCVVGDDDQSIYRFRGAELMNILTFPDKFPNTRVIKLEENYRSDGNILKIAEKVVSNNLGRHGKTLWTKKTDGEKGRLVFFEDQFAEARFCADLVDSDSNYDGTAILYRTNAQSAAFETVFMRMGIPYKIVGALRFYDREEVKDALAILALVLNPADEVAFRRIINKPARGIGEVSLEKILKEAENEYGNCPAGLRNSLKVLRGKAKQGAEDFLFWYTAALENLEKTDLAELTQTALKDSGILEYHRQQDQIALTQKVNNLEELVNATSVYPPGRVGLSLFLESLELDPTRLGKQDPSDKPGVTLITMHNTKGLEFDRVIISGMEEGLFPGRANETDDDIEEERRIFYVSITRARHLLYFTACRKRSIWGRSSYQMPSRFLRELPMEYVKIEGTPPFGSGFGAGSGFGTGSGFGAGYGSGFGSRTEPSYSTGSSYGKAPSKASNASRGGTQRSGAGRNPGFGKQIQIDSPKFNKSGFKASDNDSPKGVSSALYTAGDRVYHEQYGSGYITESSMENGREVVTVWFDTGRTAKFIPKYARLEKIAQD